MMSYYNRMKKRALLAALWETKVWRDELHAAKRVLLENTAHNSAAKTYGTLLLLTVWSSIYTLISLGIAHQPPHFIPFTVLSWSIFARWWGIELAWEKIGVTSQEREEMKQQRDGGKK